MGTFNYLQNVGILQDQCVQPVDTAHFCLPAISFSRNNRRLLLYLCRLEHANHNWNAVMTAPVPVADIYFSKLLSASAMVLLTQVWIGALFVISVSFRV